MTKQKLFIKLLYWLNIFFIVSLATILIGMTLLVLILVLCFLFSSKNLASLTNFLASSGIPVRNLWAFIVVLIGIILLVVLFLAISISVTMLIGNINKQQYFHQQNLKYIRTIVYADGFIILLKLALSVLTNIYHLNILDGLIAKSSNLITPSVVLWCALYVLDILFEKGFALNTDSKQII